MSSPKKPDHSDETKDSSEKGAGKDSAEDKQEDAAQTLADFFTKKLQIKDEEVVKVLDSLNLEGVAKYIKEKKCKNVITMAGAGISTSAGIPDFRSPDSGLYANLQEYDLPSPEAIFSIQFFKENPKPFFRLAKELYPGVFKPTVCHYFLKMLNDEGLLLRHYTQNIDTLEREAGLEGDKIIEAHGTFHTSHCLECAAEYSMEWMKVKIFKDEIPVCDQDECEGVVKPDIVFFGERLPDKFFKCVSEDMKKCDLLIILGTSLVVQPFASLTSKVPAECPRLYINLEKTTGGGDFMSMLFGGGFKFDAEDNYRDVFWQGTCDDGCQALADLLGWGVRLREFVKSEHARKHTLENISASAASNYRTKTEASKQGAISKAVSSTSQQNSESRNFKENGLQHYTEAADMIDIKEEDIPDINICVII